MIEIALIHRDCQVVEMRPRLVNSDKWRMEDGADQEAGDDVEGKSVLCSGAAVYVTCGNVLIANMEM